MADVINLRQARKAKRRKDAAKAAQSSRARHGRTKADKIASALEDAKAERALDGAKLEPDDSSKQ